VIELPDDLAVDSPSSGEINALRELIANLKDRVEAQDRELAAKNQQIEQLHVLLREAQAALPAPREGRPWWRRVWGKQ
jgi:hypothetical protein